MEKKFFSGALKTLLAVFIVLPACSSVAQAGRFSPTSYFKSKSSNKKFSKILRTFNSRKIWRYTKASLYSASGLGAAVLGTLFLMKSRVGRENLLEKVVALPLMLVYVVYVTAMEVLEKVASNAPILLSGPLFLVSFFLIRAAYLLVVAKAKKIKLKTRSPKGFFKT